MAGNRNSRPAKRPAAIVLGLLLLISVVPRAGALDSFVSVEKFLAMEREERFTFMIGALDTYATLGGAGLYRSRDFHMRVDRLLSCAHRHSSEDLLSGVTREAEKERTDKAARTAMASALPRYLEAVCSDVPE